MTLTRCEGVLYILSRSNERFTSIPRGRGEFEGGAEDSAVTFYERVEKDTELQEKLKEFGSKEKIESYVKNDLGYVFTKEEMQKVIFERNPDLSDEELEQVVGGVLDWVAVGFFLVGIGVPAFVLNAVAAAA